MIKEEWESLIACPGWKALRRFLSDRRDAIKDQIAEGMFTDRDLDQAIFRCQDLKDLAEMDWATIEKFYAAPDMEVTTDET